MYVKLEYREYLTITYCRTKVSIIISSGEIKSAIILENDTITILDGGVATTTTINNGGRSYVSSGGVTNSTTINEGGILHISSGGTADSTTINEGGMLNVSAGGTATSTTISDWGMMNVFLNGLADATAISSDGRLYISSGGTANDTLVESAGYLYVSRGGTANVATVESGARLYVSSGGTIAGLTALSGACLNFYIAPNTYIEGTYDGSAFLIANGQIVNYTINNNCKVYVSSGCMVNVATVTSNGELRIRSGGIANNTTVNAGGEFYIQNGGTATDIEWTPCEGHVYVYDGACATFVSEYSGIYFGSGNQLLSCAPVMENTPLDADFEMYVMNGGTASRATVNSGGRLYISSGGIADHATVNSGGSMDIYSGGTANSATVNDGGFLYVSSGGVADSAAINSGRLYISGGGTAVNTAVDNDGRLYVSSGGTADYATLNSGGSMNICSGGTANNATVNSGGELNVSNGGTVNNAIVNEDGELYVSSGGTLNGATVNSMGLIYVCNGGRATEIRENGGFVYVGVEEDVTFIPNTIEDLLLENGSATLHSGTTANSATINEDGRLQIRGGQADHVTVNDYASVDIHSSSVVSHLTVNTGGSVVIYRGGTVAEIRENGGYVDVNSNATVSFLSNTLNGLELEDGRYATLHSGTTATDTTLNFDGGLFIRGGQADHITVNDGGELMVSEGQADSATVNFRGFMSIVRTGTATNTAINSGGNVSVSFGGTTTDVEVFYGGNLVIGSGGSAINAMVNDGGNMFVDSDGVATDVAVLAGGNLKMASGGTIYSTVIQSGGVITGHIDCQDVQFDPGAILQFDISVIAPGNENALVNLAGLAETLDCPAFSLPVNDSVEYGEYKLAEAAWGFEQKTISVANSVMDFGSLSLGQSVAVGNREYTLNLDNGDLILSVNAAQPAQYVYLDFDGEELVRYSNPDLALSLDLSVADPVFSEAQRAAVVSALSEQYEKYNIAFTLDRQENVDYSTIYFGVSSAFDEYGDFFGIAETCDGNDQNRSDNAFVLLDSAYSDDQIIAVAADMLDHLMGFSYSGAADGSPVILKYAKSEALLSLSAGWDQQYPYNQYCPIDPRTEERSVVGCTNTAASQIIYYWLEKGLLDLSLTLVDSDAYQSNPYITIESSDDPECGHLSFAETNQMLQIFDILSDDCIAALCFAAGVVQQADYSSNETETAWSKNLFIRAGFEKDEAAKNYEFSSSMSDYDIMVYELLHGRPVGVSLLKQEHAIVADGYDSSRNMFHLDFGWGNDSNRWYTMEELDYLRIYVEISGYTPVATPNLTARDLSAGEDSVIWNKDITLSFTISNEGNEVSEETMAYIYCEDTIIGACGVDYISSGYSRGLTCTVNTAPLQLGKNVLTVKIGSQNGEGIISTASVTVNCKNSDVAPQTQTWEEVAGTSHYIAEYSTDDFEHVIQLVADSNSLDTFLLPEGNYQMRVKPADGEWTVLGPVVAQEASDEPKLIRSNADGNADVLFANSVGVWESGYAAQHVGSSDNTWSGTNEIAVISGKNKLTDIIEGSTDANVLLMTDDKNGDVLFVDDIYSASPSELGLSQSRVAQINEIRAGAGNDIVDMTSQRFEYIGHGLTIRGGNGNDIIWANKGDNFLFGDAGNDRIVGASGKDVIAGGIGNDRMHGGGGDDIFTFCGDWGNDEIEQLDCGTITLWFTSDFESKVVWDEVSRSCTDGENYITVNGVAQVTIKFGGVGDDATMFAALSEAGAFESATSWKIFEESKGVLA